ncbi:MAG TPA: hypothetical protein PLJ99_00315 [Kiritimatiellia bacterium]|nr:hypothetical protein [Kiritimatiellia bacterium]HPJ57517.1 hypothetical protein [Kiritimatiellia bacterium]HPR67712.1 hypothetical protein [Kiritimatiellia bacterium]HRX05634.1 hypothetical protein [Kiritimatiellia bacterium]
MTAPALPALALILLVIFGLLAWLFVSAAFLLWGARLAGIEKRSFGRAVGTLLLGGIASSLLTGILSVEPVLGTGLGLLLGFGVSALVMMALFDTTFAKALAATILAWVLSLAVAAAVALIALAVFGLLFALAA